MARSKQIWTRRDSLVVLASYADKPAHLMIPPAQERERVANLLGQPVCNVTAKLWAFAALDPLNSSTSGAVGKWEETLWERYCEDRMALMVDADEALEERRRVPYYLAD